MTKYKLESTSLSEEERATYNELDFTMVMHQYFDISILHRLSNTMRDILDEIGYDNEPPFDRQQVEHFVDYHVDTVLIKTRIVENRQTFTISVSSHTYMSLLENPDALRDLVAQIAQDERFKYVESDKSILRLSLVQVIIKAPGATMLLIMVRSFTGDFSYHLPAKDTKQLIMALAPQNVLLTEDKEDEL